MAIRFNVGSHDGSYLVGGTGPESTQPSFVLMATGPLSPRRISLVIGSQ